MFCGRARASVGPELAVVVEVKGGVGLCGARRVDLRAVVKRALDDADLIKGVVGVGVAAV